jgi:cytochrome c-type biogenesis protein CcmH/NrfF
MEMSRLTTTGKGTASSRAVTTDPQPRARLAFAQDRLPDAAPFRKHARILLRRSFQLILLTLAVFALLGAGDESARVNDLGHRMMCVCGCNQILLECNHVGCAYSDRMRAELVAAVDRGDNDDLTLQGFVQKYGTTVMAAPTKTGFNRVAWIMPYLVLVLGLAMVTLIVRAWRSRPLVLPAGAVAAVHGAELEHFRDQARKDTEV